jgi:DNA-directed RNA polymerase subunit beta'
VASVQKRYERGVITNGERYNKVIDTVDAHYQRSFRSYVPAISRGQRPGIQSGVHDGRFRRPWFEGADSPVGRDARPDGQAAEEDHRAGVGEIIETPITSNFREGLSVQEYFISTHGARKGLADTALKTADAGYLTRRLVDVAQDVIVREVDCATIIGLDVAALKEGEEVIESLADRVLGRVSLDDIYDPITDELIIAAGEEIKEAEAARIEEAGIETVRIRSVLTCETKYGVCAKCYGRNLANRQMVDIGEAVGVIAAQSIGEPGTQLTLRTFHIGGTAARIAEQSQVLTKHDGVVKLENVTLIDREDGTTMISSRDGVGELVIQDDRGRTRNRFKLPYGAHLVVKDGQELKKGDTIFEWDPYTGVIMTERAGSVKFKDIILDVTVREEIDDQTGLIQRKVIDYRDKTLFPTINIVSAGGKTMASYRVPTDAQLQVTEAQEVKPGDTLVKMPRMISKSRDITGGLPRVAELFEARRPHDPAVISEVDGVVEFGKIVRGQQQIIVKGEQDEVKEYLVPHGKHLMVHDADYVRAGDRLCEGSVDPHDILRILGVYAVQAYLVNEIQEVYRLQGVKINDKHIETIVRQMLQKVQVEQVGDTDFLEGEKVDKTKFLDENARIIAEGGDPATAEPLLLGITRASLSTESFISAASFQETTRVLTEAAISGKIDYLMGLKENVIIGRLIPAGTGIESYRKIEVEHEDEEARDLDDRDDRRPTVADIFKENA